MRFYFENKKNEKSCVNNTKYAKYYKYGNVRSKIDFITFECINFNVLLMLLLLCYGSIFTLTKTLFSSRRPFRYIYLTRLIFLILNLFIRFLFFFSRTASSIHIPSQQSFKLISSKFIR